MSRFLRPALCCLLLLAGGMIHARAQAVLFRVNPGGPALTSEDAGPDWEGDTSGSPSPYHNGVSNISTANITGVDSSVPAGIPDALFNLYRWDPTGAPEMLWTFPVGTPGNYEVRLYFANGYSGTSTPGTRLFDVVIESNTVLDDYDITADVGHQIGVMKSFIVASDASLEIEFLHNVENPMINGIEILAADTDGYLAASPGTLALGLVETGTTSGSQAITVTNLGQPGDATISIGSATASGEFAHDLVTPTNLLPGDNVVINVTFSPTAVGPVAETLTLTHDGSNSPVAIALTGEGYDPGAIPISFSKSSLAGESSTNPTSLQFGPDDRLYVAHQNGQIKVYTVTRNAPADYEVTATETIELIRDIPNHNDDGGLNAGVTNRQLTGLVVSGTAANPVIYAGSSDPRIGGGGGATDTFLDTNSGVISRLTWNGSSWDKLDLVRGLPRSEENHSTNGLQLDEAAGMLYVVQGGHTNQGGPSNNFTFTPEYALSAAILSIDLDAIGESTYDLPTLDDEERPGNPDAGDPFGGNNGKNQAMLVPGGPVQVYAPGFRNAYDLLINSLGRMYTIDNGPNSGWGDVPVGEGPGGTCTNEVSEPGATHPDNLHFVSGPGYYGGHPNPTRANTANLFNPNNPQSPVTAGNPVECDYRTPGVDDGALATWPASTNGLAEYTASNFGGAMTGDLLATSFNDTVQRIKLNAAGDTAVLVEALFSAVGGNPLDVITRSDLETYPGTIWVATHGGDNLLIYEPLDFGFCDNSYDAGLDSDGDGFDNADEIDNGTSPCSPGDIPPDVDGDLISDLNDPDDDNDGIGDMIDRFARDPDDGLTTPLPVIYTWDNDAPPAGGLLGTGFTGLMTNGSTDYLDQFDPTMMTVGGAAGVLTVDEADEGSPRDGGNDARYAFQFGFDPGSAVGTYTAQTRVLAPFGGLTLQDTMEIGLFVGPGDQANYAALVVSAAGGGQVSFGLETGDVHSAGAQAAVALPGPESMDLYLTIDPVAGTVQPAYSIIDGGMEGPIVTLGAPVAVPAGWLAGPDGLAVGILSTSSGPAPPFPATWERIEVTLGAAGSGCGESTDGDLDGVCAVLDNCPAVANPGQEDLDGDLVGDACDCAPADPLDGPGAEMDDSLELTDGTTLAWDDQGIPGPFHVYRGAQDQGQPFAYGHSCLSAGVAASSTSDGTTPAAGSLFYYLVSRQGCPESAVGRDSLGQAIPNPAPCMP